MTSTFSANDPGEAGLGSGYSESLKTFSPEALDFLNKGRLRQAADWTELSSEAVEDCLEAAARVQTSEDLQKLTWHAYRTLYLAEDGQTRHWPSHILELGDLTGAFYLILALSGIDGMVATHREHGIPEHISRLNCRDIHIWANEFKNLGKPHDHGFAHEFTPPRWGLNLRGFRWIVHSLVGRILRVGRLQFIHDTFGSPFRAYRNRRTHQVQVVSEAGQRFTEAGWIAGDSDPDGWDSVWSITTNRVLATPILPSGRAGKDPVTLDLSEWEPALVPGESILEVHIPEDGPMDFEACGESVREVIRDYTTYYPDRNFTAVVCQSWLLDPQFQQGMRETSNICRFQRECYLYPLSPGGGRSGLFRLFTSDDLDTLPRDTTMRRTYLDLLNAGGLWRGGGMILFPEDVAWGSQPYLKQHGLI